MREKYQKFIIPLKFFSSCFVCLIKKYFPSNFSVGKIKIGVVNYPFFGDDCYEE